jgi:protease-4
MIGPQDTQSSQVPPAAPPPPARPTPPPRRRRSGWLIGLIGCGGLIVLLVLVAVIVAMVGSGDFGDKVAVIRITGTISSGQSSAGLFSTGAGAETVGAQLRAAAADNSVRAILIRINSPGGSAAGSQEIYNAVADVPSSKPVVVSMGDVAASGGYYAASAADRIVASPASVTASIGVLSVDMPMRGLFNKLGIDPNVVTSGKNKAMGAFDPLTREQRQMVQGLVDRLAAQFLGDVLKGRRRVVPKLDEKRIREIADGRVVSGDEAKQLGLVDQLGGYHDALLLAGRLAGIKGEPRTTEYGRPGLVERVLGSSARAPVVPHVGDYLFYSPLAAALGGESLQ